jgi:glycosyltransferase involved in cell wall biosynthesis
MANPLRILHVAGLMGPPGGGAEVWLMEAYRRIDRSRFQFDFLIHTPDRLLFHDEIEALGGRLLRACRPLYLWKYGRTFRRLVAENGPYDACHVHVPYCGHALRLARTAGIPVRIAHGHSGSFSVGFSFWARTFLGWTNRWVTREATGGIACSRRAGEALFGSAWEQDERWRVLHCGIDLDRFRRPVDGARMRAELDIPAGAHVIGHVGRFQREKNHAFLLQVVAEALRRNQRVWLLLVGDGPLRAATEAQAQRLGIRERVIFAGVRKDVPDLMRGVMNVLALPSLFEGFPLVGIEAQAAGLPLVYSDAITDEIGVIPGLTRAVPLSSSAAWVEALLAAESQRSGLEGTALRGALDRFSIEHSAARLMEVYDEFDRARRRS